MKMKALSLAASLVLLAAGTASAQDVKIRFAHSLSTTEPAHIAAENFAKRVAERTKGKVQLQVFPSEQLGSGKEVNEMIRQGANVMNITDPGYLSDFVPDIGVLNGPYVVKDPKGIRQAAGVGLVQGCRPEDAAGGFPPDHDRRLLRPASCDRGQAGARRPPIWPA